MADFLNQLCAMGTAAGAGAVGLSFGSEEQPDVNYRPSSKKRKAPGPGSLVRSFSTPLLESHSIVHPTNLSTPNVLALQGDEVRGSTSYGTSTRPAFWRRMSLNMTQLPTSTPSISRQSSVATRLSFMSRIDQDPESTVERTDVEGVKSSSWLKRISTMSSLSGSPSPSIRPATPSVSFSNTSAKPFLSSGPPGSLPPNKLVKRTSSHRALSANQSKSHTLRRPATSHQRSATFGQMNAADLLHNPAPEPQPEPSAAALIAASSSTPPVWRPYFSSGYDRSKVTYPRKRHTSGASRTDSIRPIRNVSDQHPTLLSARTVETRLSEDDLDDDKDRAQSKDRLAEADRVHHLHRGTTTSVSSGPNIKRRSRHSFSISDAFSSNSSAVSTDSRASEHRLREQEPDTSTVSAISTSKAATGHVTSRARARTVNMPRRKRTVTDPILQQFKTHDLRHSDFDEEPAVVGTTKSPLSPISNVSTFDVDLPRGTPSFPSTPFSETSAEFSIGSRVPSSSHAPSLDRTKRISLAPSDPASTTFGSDNDTRVFSSGDEDSMEFQSDTAYDSLATRATASSHSGMRGPGIETIFDESPSPDKARELIALQDLMNSGTLDGLAISVEKRPRTAEVRTDSPDMHDGATSTRSRSAMQDEDRTNGGTDHVSTPLSTPGSEEEDFMMTPVPKKHRQPGNMTSSPRSVIRNGHEYTTDDIHRSIEAMSIDDESEWNKTTDLESVFDESTNLPEFPKHSSWRGTPLQFRVHQDLVQSTDPDFTDWHAEQRLSIFDWSEQQSLERDQLNGSSPRPKTVHGKQTMDNHRGSRASGRRGPSALHLRSQSVPVARESIMENDPHYPATKFGTWGLGNKGVSEEWNDDFDFDDLDESDGDRSNGLPSNAAPVQLMKVPQSIIDRQASVHGQFSQVQEFMLLVEELKRLRVHGGALQLLSGQFGPLWEDAENIVNLATLNDDDDDLRPPRSPRSPSTFDGFDDDSPPLNRFRNLSELNDDENESFEPTPRRSISSITTTPSGRPRGESLAQAKSFLQTIHQNRNGPDSSAAEIEIYEQKKLPFDTQDLRDLVGRASTVTRALKEIIRKAEGVSVSPDKTPKKFSDPAFSQIFHRIEESNSQSPSPTFQKPPLPKSRSAHSYLGSSTNGGGSVSPQDMPGHMKMMTVI